MAVYRVQDPSGQMHDIQGPDGATPEQVLAQAQKIIPATPPVPSEGTIGSFLRAVGNQLPLGPQFAALASKGPYSQNMQAINEATARDKAQNPIAYGAGAVGGAVAPGLIPGVGEMMAANPATTGAILGGTNAISNTDIQKHPLEAVNQAGTGAATGALLSGLISKMLPTASTLEEKANTLANKSVNMPKGVLVDMTPEEQQAQGAALRAGGVVSSNKQQAFDKASGLLDDYGSKIGEIAKKTEGQGLTADPEQHYSVMSNLLNKAQEFSGSANKVSKAIGRDYKAGATDIANLPDNPSWGEIQALKEKYGSFAFKPSATQGAKDTYFALSNMLKGIADKAQSDPSLGAEYKKALAGYSQMSPVVDGLKESVDAELRGATGSGIGFHPMRMLASMPRPVRAVGGTVAALTGHPILTVAAGLPEAMNPAIQSNVTGGLANAMPSTQNVMTQLATKATTNASTQKTAVSNLNDLIQRLTDKYNQRRKF